MTNFLITAGFTAFESVWRRTHGGGPISNWFNKYVSPWLFGLTARVFFTTLNLIAVACLGLFYKDLVWWKAAVLVGSVWVYWDASFGMYMDIGRKQPVSSDDRRCYRNTPFNWVLHWIFPDDMQYGKTYDFVQMWFRYTWPLVLVPAFGVASWWILSLGLAVAATYASCWRLYEMKVIGVAPTELSEYVIGAATGLLLCIC